MANICKLCGKNEGLVGRRHHCVPVPKMARAEVVAHSERTQERIARGEVLKGGSYRYRDPEKRKAYMRTYMAKWRKGSAAK